MEITGSITMIKKVMNVFLKGTLNRELSIIFYRYSVVHRRFYKST